MRYSFQDILNKEIYTDTRVIFLFGKYNIFINIVADEFKLTCMENNRAENVSNSVSSEFGFNETEEEIVSTSVDLSTFFEVVTVPNINGKWFCKAELDTITKKQKEHLLRYIKEPNENGVLVITSNNWLVYKEFLNNRVLGTSKVSSIMQLNFPYRNVLKDMVKQLFQDRGIKIDSDAADFFILRMNKSYDEYEIIIDEIRNQHTEADLSLKDIKVYMKGIERFDIDDFIREIVKPLPNSKADGKKVLKIMVALEDELGAKNLVYQLIKKVDEMIEYRLLINKGIIPIGIKYFFGDVIKQLGGEQGKYGKVNEYTFRKKADLASQTSLRDWEYIKLILTKAIEDNKISDSEMELKCQRALYEMCNRSILSASRINNILGIENILNNDIEALYKI